MHARTLAAQEAATRAAQEQQMADQQTRAEAEEAAVQAHKLQVLEASQKRIVTNVTARYAAKEREALRPKVEKVHFTDVPHSERYVDAGTSAKDDPDPQVLSDDPQADADDLQRQQDDHRARAQADEDEDEWQHNHASPNPYFTPYAPNLTVKPFSSSPRGGWT